MCLSLGGTGWISVGFWKPIISCQASSFFPKLCMLASLALCPQIFVTVMVSLSFRFNFFFKKKKLIIFYLKKY